MPLVSTPFRDPSIQTPMLPSRFVLVRALLPVLALLLTVPVQAADRTSLAVLPFWCPSDQDFGVTISDRFAMDLMQRTTGESDRRRYTLLEVDPLSRDLLRQASCHPDSLTPEQLASLRSATEAGMLFGACEIPNARPNPSIKRFQFRLLDLESGEVEWAGAAKSDTRFIWAAKKWEGGRRLVDDVMEQLDLTNGKVPPDIPGEAVPERVAILPPSNSRNPRLVEAFTRSLQRVLIREKIFVVVSGTGKNVARIGASHRDSLEQRKADAVLAGSLLTVGVNPKIEDNLVLALRLVDLDRGRILWTDTFSTRRLWWKEEPEEMVEQAAAHFAEGLAASLGKNGVSRKN